MQIKLKKQKFAQPYKKNGLSEVTTFNLRGRAGVYIVREQNSTKVLYVGFSATDVYKALYRHFQSWKDRRQQRVTFDRWRVVVRVVYCSNKTTAARLEKALIIKLQPSENIDKYWLNYDIDAREAETLSAYDAAPTEGIFIYDGDLDF